MDRYVLRASPGAFDAGNGRTPELEAPAGSYASRLRGTVVPDGGRVLQMPHTDPDATPQGPSGGWSPWSHTRSRVSPADPGADSHQRGRPAEDSQPRMSRFTPSPPPAPLEDYSPQTPKASGRSTPPQQALRAGDRSPRTPPQTSTPARVRRVATPRMSSPVMAAGLSPYATPGRTATPARVLATPGRGIDNAPLVSEFPLAASATPHRNLHASPTPSRPDGGAPFRIFDASGVLDEETSGAVSASPLPGSVLIALDTVVYNYEVAEGATSTVYHARHRITAVGCDADCGIVAIGLEDGLVSISEVHEKCVTQRATLTDHVHPIRAVGVGGGIVAAASATHVLTVVSAAAAHSCDSSRVHLEGSPVAIAVSDMGSHIAVGYASGGGSIFHTTRLNEPAAFAVEVEGPLTAMAWAPTALRDGPAAVLAHAAGESCTVLKCLHLGSGHRDASVDFGLPLCSVQWLKLVPTALAVSTGAGRDDYANSVLIVPVPQYADEPLLPTRTFSSHSDPVRWCVVDVGHATMATAAAGADSTIRFWQSVVSDAAQTLVSQAFASTFEDFDTMHTVR